MSGSGTKQNFQLPLSTKLCSSEDNSASVPLCSQNLSASSAE